MPSTVIVLPTWFQRPPPSLAASLLVRVLPVMFIVATAVTCTPPPFPGFGVPAAISALFPIKEAFVISNVPATISTPPPARFAAFPSIIVPVIVTAPSVVKIPPPEPDTPLARLL